MSEVMELPVYKWRVRNEPADTTRNRRQAAGSGDDLFPDEEDDYDEDEYDAEDDNDDDNEGVTVAPRTDKPSARTPGVLTPVIDEHPHRHHHGEDNIAGIGSGVNVSDLLNILQVRFTEQVGNFY